MIKSVSTTADATTAPPPKAPPVKLNPVRVPIPEESPKERTGGFEEILHPYSLEDAVLEAKRCIQCGRPYCVEACPITQDCREYIHLVAERKFDEAAHSVLQENPLATTLCKVCYHYCEESCIIAKRGVPIAIRHLKRSSLELGNSNLTYVPSAPRNQRVAVVGGGPAGLMAAWELGIRGYSVTVFEQEVFLGGQAMTIPKYRMDGNEIDLDLARFKGLDVAFVKGRKVGVDLPAENLLHEGYQAVYLSVGTPSHRSLGIVGEHLPGVFPALPLLKDLNSGKRVELGKKIIIVGGGDVAMDAVRSALRLAQGGEVTLIYRRSREEMPADKEEVHGAESEGIKFLYQHTPVQILGTTHVEGVVFEQMELGPPDASGRRSPMPIPGSHTTLPCDTLIVAVGQKADLTGFPQELDVKLGSQGWPQGKHEDMMTGIEGIFASGGKSVVYAMASGSRAAEAIDAYLREKKGEAPAPRPNPFGGTEPLPARPKGYTKQGWHL